MVEDELEATVPSWGGPNVGGVAREARGGKSGIWASVYFDDL